MGSEEWIVKKATKNMALAGIAGAITYAIGSLIAFSGLLINMKKAEM